MIFLFGFFFSAVLDERREVIANRLGVALQGDRLNDVAVLVLADNAAPLDGVSCRVELTDMRLLAVESVKGDGFHFVLRAPPSLAGVVFKLMDQLNLKFQLLEDANIVLVISSVEHGAVSSKGNRLHDLSVLILANDIAEFDVDRIGMKLARNNLVRAARQKDD